MKLNINTTKFLIKALKEIRDMEEPRSEEHCDKLYERCKEIANDALEKASTKKNDFKNI